MFPELQILLDDAKECRRICHAREEYEDCKMYRIFAKRLEGSHYTRFLEEEYDERVHGNISDAVWEKFLNETYGN